MGGWCVALATTLNAPTWRELLGADNEAQLEPVTTVSLEVVSYSLFFKLVITDPKLIHLGSSYEANLI